MVYGYHKRESTKAIACGHGNIQWLAGKKDNN